MTVDRCPKMLQEVIRTIAPLLWRPQLKNLQAMIVAGILMSTRGELRRAARAKSIAEHRKCLGHFLSHPDGDVNSKGFPSGGVMLTRKSPMATLLGRRRFCFEEWSRLTG